jgi:hypothetical protein
MLFYLEAHRSGHVCVRITNRERVVQMFYSAVSSFLPGSARFLCIRAPSATCLLAVVLTLVAAAASGVSLNEDYVSADDEEVVQEGRSTDGG